MKAILLVLGAAFFGGVLLYGKRRRTFLIFQAVMFPSFVYFFGADVMELPGLPGGGTGSSGIWFLPFVVIWIAGTVALGLRSLWHLLSDATP